MYGQVQAVPTDPMQAGSLMHMLDCDRILQSNFGIEGLLLIWGRVCVRQGIHRHSKHLSW